MNGDVERNEAVEELRYKITVLCDGCGVMRVAARAEHTWELESLARTARQPLEAEGWRFSPRDDQLRHLGDFCPGCAGKRRM